MKAMSSVLAATFFFFCGTTGASAAPASIEKGDTVGHSSLPAGQYILTNLATGHSIFVDISSRGQMVGKLPQAAVDQLKKEASAANQAPEPAPAQATSSTVTASPTAPGQTVPGQTTSEPATFNLKDLFKSELGKALQGKDAQKFMQKMGQ